MTTNPIPPDARSAMREQVAAQRSIEQAEHAPQGKPHHGREQFDRIRSVENILQADLGAGGYAAHLAATLRGQMICDVPADRWYLLTDTVHWRPDQTREIYHLAMRVLQRDVTDAKFDMLRRAKTAEKDEADRLQSLAKIAKREIKSLGQKNTIQSILFLAAAGPNGIGVVGADTFDKDPMLFGAANCTICLRTGTRIKSLPEHYITLQSDVAYDETAQCPRWRQFFDEIFLGNESLARHAWKALGSCMTGLIREHKLRILLGSGRNGKSTLVDVLLRVLGDYGTMLPVELILDSNAARNPHSATPGHLMMKGRRGVFTEEISGNRRLASGAAKQFTGGGKMEGRALYEKESTQFDPTHKLFVCTNVVPRFDAEDFALQERFEFFPIEGVFVDREPQNERERRADLGLKDKLLAELPGILNWLIEGCLLWQAEGMEPVPEAVKAAGKEIHKDMDHVGAFLDEWTVRGPGVGNYGASKLWEVFRIWCKTVGLREPFQQPGFGRSLRSHGLERIKNSNPVQYRDIRLTDEAQAKVDSAT